MTQLQQEEVGPGYVLEVVVTSQLVGVAALSWGVNGATYVGQEEHANGDSGIVQAGHVQTPAMSLLY